MNSIVNLHRRDRNIGDLMSAPTLYFDFPNAKVIRAEVTDVEEMDLGSCHVILGGGGLFDEFFLSSIERIRARLSTGKLVAWGVGQQLDYGKWWRDYRSFPYEQYLKGIDLVGVRDYGAGLPWVPCASCMHETFDKVREPKHEFVVFSHRSRPVPIQGWPTLRNDQADFEETVDFLGSGETVITSSYHGMYWGLLLGRRVLAFPFNSKFLTNKYPVTMYPAVWQRRTGLSAKIHKLFGREVSTYACKTKVGWRVAAAASRAFPEVLRECRERNRAFYQDVLELFDQ